MFLIETNNGKGGGTLKGKPHNDKQGNPIGGIKAVVTDANKPVELEGGEVIINKAAAKKHWKKLSEINQSAGGGVPIQEPQFGKGGKMAKGGGIKGRSVQAKGFPQFTKTGDFKYVLIESSGLRGFQKWSNSKSVLEKEIDFNKKHNDWDLIIVETEDIPSYANGSSINADKVSDYINMLEHTLSNARLESKLRQNYKEELNHLMLGIRMGIYKPSDVYDPSKMAKGGEVKQSVTYNGETYTVGDVGEYGRNRKLVTITKITSKDWVYFRFHSKPVTERDPIARFALRFAIDNAATVNKPSKQPAPKTTPNVIDSLPFAILDKFRDSRAKKNIKDDVVYTIIEINTFKNKVVIEWVHSDGEITKSSYSIKDATESFNNGNWVKEDEKEIKTESTKSKPSTDPTTWGGTFNIGDKVKIRGDMSMNLNIGYLSAENNFTITSIEKGGATPYKVDKKGNSVGGFIRPENPTGFLYVLNKNGGNWEGKDLELIGKGASQTIVPIPPRQKPTPPPKKAPINYEQAMNNWVGNTLMNTQIVNGDVLKDNILQNFSIAINNVTQ